MGELAPPDVRLYGRKCLTAGWLLPPCLQEQLSSTTLHGSMAGRTNRLIRAMLVMNSRYERDVA